MADDAELLRRSALGDEAAYASFVARHEAGVWRRARTLASNEADAEDLLQETFLAAWRAAGNFRGGNARSWLLTIATHAWQRVAPRVAREVATGDDEELEVLAERAGWGTGVHSENPAQAWIEAALHRLAPGDRTLLMLRDVEAIPAEEVAATLGLTLSATKSRLHRARMRLAAAYEEVRRESV